MLMSRGEAVHVSKEGGGGAISRRRGCKNKGGTDTHFHKMLLYVFILILTSSHSFLWYHISSSYLDETNLGVIAEVFYPEAGCSGMHL